MYTYSEVLAELVSIISKLRENGLIVNTRDKKYNREAYVNSIFYFDLSSERFFFDIKEVVSEESNKTYYRMFYIDRDKETYPVFFNDFESLIDKLFEEAYIIQPVLDYWNKDLLELFYNLGYLDKTERIQYSYRMIKKISE